MTNTQNTSAGSFDTKFIYYYPFPVVIDKGEIEYENKSTVLDKQREINRHEKRDSKHRPSYHLPRFRL